MPIEEITCTECDALQTCKKNEISIKGYMLMLNKQYTIIDYIIQKYS